MSCLCFRRLSSRISREVIYFFILLHNVNVIISQNCTQNNGTAGSIVSCHWRDGVIPFTFNFYSLSPRRLRSLVKKGHNYMETRSCLTFKEYSPIELSEKKNITHLFYNYSDVLEMCCMTLYSGNHSRRLVLITPQCMLPAEVAHATLHAIGFHHSKKQPFEKQEVKDMLFEHECANMKMKMKLFDKTPKSF